MKRCFLLLLICFLLIGGTSCRRQGGNRRYFAYLDVPARATLTGKINSLSFCAILETGGRSEGGGVDATLTFTAPASLAGISLACLDGDWTVSLGSLAGETGAQGLGRIAALVTEERAVRSARAEGESIVLTLSDGASLILDKKTGAPLRAAWSDGQRAIEVVIAEW